MVKLFGDDFVKRVAKNFYNVQYSVEEVKQYLIEDSVVLDKLVELSKQLIKRQKLAKDPKYKMSSAEEKNIKDYLKKSLDEDLMINKDFLYDHDAKKADTTNIFFKGTKKELLDLLYGVNYGVGSLKFPPYPFFTKMINEIQSRSDLIKKIKVT